MLRRSTDETNPEDWFEFAAERLKSADALWRYEGLTATGIELLQEAVERYLKGFLIANGWRLVKIHDLRVLVQEAEAFNTRFADFNALAKELTEEFFAQHYPGGDLTHLGENYESLRQQAGELVALIQKSLPQFFPLPNPPSSVRNP